MQPHCQNVDLRKLFSTWKMFEATLTFAFVVVYVAAEIPSYIHVCDRRDPNLKECILENVYNLKDKICYGMPELGTQAFEPLHFDRIDVINTTNSKVFITDVEISGLCDYTINSFHLNLDAYQFDFNATFRQIKINSTYHVDVRILVPIVSKGPLYLITDNMSTEVNMAMKVVNKNGKRYVYLSNLKLKLDIGDVDSQFTPEEDQNKTLQQAIFAFLGSNKKEIIETVKPYVEEIVSNNVFNTVSSLLKHFTYDELFPDQI